jgi:protein-S-isoprenylcysteine O-methyltransferase Ste14
MRCMGLASLMVLVMLLIRLPKEEEKLIERFRDEYQIYMKRTGRLLVRIERDQTGTAIPGRTRP